MIILIYNQSLHLSVSVVSFTMKLFSLYLRIYIIIIYRYIIYKNTHTNANAYTFEY